MSSRGAGLLGLPGPLKRRAGRVIKALNKSKTAPTVIPIKRKGRSSIQIMGYKIRASKASGQQITNKISHNKNLVKSYPPSISLKREKYKFQSLFLLLNLTYFLPKSFIKRS